VKTNRRTQASVARTRTRIDQRGTRQEKNVTPLEAETEAVLEHCVPAVGLPKNKSSQQNAIPVVDSEPAENNTKQSPVANRVTSGLAPHRRNPSTQLRQRQDSSAVGVSRNSERCWSTHRRYPRTPTGEPDEKCTALWPKHKEWSVERHASCPSALHKPWGEGGSSRMISDLRTNDGDRVLYLPSRRFPAGRNHAVPPASPFPTVFARSGAPTRFGRFLSPDRQWFWGEYGVRPSVLGISVCAEVWAAVCRASRSFHFGTSVGAVESHVQPAAPRVDELRQGVQLLDDSLLASWLLAFVRTPALSNRCTCHVVTMVCAHACCLFGTTIFYLDGSPAEPQQADRSSHSLLKSSQAHESL